MNEIRTELIKHGYNNQQINECIKDVNIRLSWNIGSYCLIYSRKYKKWFSGKIINIFIHQKTNEEWLVVEYNKKSKKEIQRFNPFVKSPNFKGQYNQKIITFICHKLKQQDVKDFEEIAVNEQIFKENKNECMVKELKEDDDIIHSCSHLTRIAEALRYCHALSKIPNAQRRERLIQFCNKTYINCLNDYISM